MELLMQSTLPSGFCFAARPVHQLLRLGLFARQMQGVRGQCHHIIVLAGSSSILERVQFRFQVSGLLSCLQQRQTM